MIKNYALSEQNEAISRVVKAWKMYKSMSGVDGSNYRWVSVCICIYVYMYI